MHIDVGGKQFTTSLSTLTAVPGSKIFDLFTGRLATVLDMKTNSYFIDRDGELFRFVLQFLRDGTLAVPDNFQVRGNFQKFIALTAIKRVFKLFFIQMAPLANQILTE